MFLEWTYIISNGVPFSTVHHRQLSIPLFTDVWRCWTWTSDVYGWTSDGAVRKAADTTEDGYGCKTGYELPDGFLC